MQEFNDFGYKKEKKFSIQLPNASYFLQIDSNGALRNLYWGKKITDPNDTYFETAIIKTAKTMTIKPIFQSKHKIAPRLVATPFPPLNLKNTGKICPKTTNTAAIYEYIP